MKQILITVALLVTGGAFSQNAASVFTKDTVVYYGLDLSNCRLIGDFGTEGAHSLKENMFPAWNEQIVNEPAKYNLNEAFHKAVVYKDLKPVAAQNAKADEQNLLTSNQNHLLDQATREKMIKSYGAGDRIRGIGLVFIIETFDKTVKLGTYYVTFFDIATRKILFSEKMREEPKGFAGLGLKNYWVGAISKGLKDITKTEYALWEAKYKGGK